MAEVSEITIVHLEDNLLDAELAAEMLLSSGLPCKLRRIYRLDEFRQCLQEYMEAPTFDLVLADFNMPGFDGLTALRMTRQIDSDVPFILLSGALGEEVAVEILRSGATDYVLKNNMQRLAPVVKRAIQEYRIRQSERKSQVETRRARDEAQKANAAKSRFLGRISHELRTPLNAIIGYTQLMQSDPMSEEQQHCSEQILKAGEHLLQLINEVLDITRIESGVIPMKIEPTLLAPVIDRSVDLVRPLARDAKVSISIDGGPCDMNILADKDRLAQVLINLITNAVKYNRANGHVFVECQQERPGFVKLLVRDTGHGIAPSKMERLFTPFDRLDLETKSSIPGTGLGLTVTKALVENMGGLIGVVSSENEGSIFWVELPTSLQYPEEEDLPESVSAVRVPDSYSLSCKVLLIEDHVPAADFLERVFRRRGNFKLTHAINIAEARERLENDCPDLVVVDLNLPDGKGEELVAELQSSAQFAHVPVIVITADACPDRRNRLIDLGSSAYFTKPIKVNALFQEVHKVLQKVQQTDGV